MRALTGAVGRCGVPSAATDVETDVDVVQGIGSGVAMVLMVIALIGSNIDDAALEL